MSESNSANNNQKDSCCDEKTLNLNEKPLANQILVIVGSGAAGFSAAIKAIELGAKVTMVERETVGGTCVNIGCIPSKFLIRAAEAYYHTVTTHGAFPFIRPNGGAVDFQALTVANSELVSFLRREKYEKILESTEGFNLKHGNVSFNGPNSLSIGDEELKFDRLLITTGASPEIPPIEGLENGPYLTSKTALELDSLPESLVVVGGGYIGLELAQAFARLGTKVTIILRRNRILGGVDRDVTESLMASLSQEGVSFINHADVMSVTYPSPTKVIVGVVREGVSVSLESTHILVTTGRKPNLPNGLDKLGVNLKDGFIAVDGHLKTTNANVFAAGDVVNSPAFVYVAAYEGALAAQNMIGSDSPVSANYSIVPWVVFTEPQVAGVGLTEEEAKAKGIEISVSILPMSALPRALVSANTEGFIKLIKPKDEDYLLGAVACMPGAGDIIMHVGLALRFKMSVKELSQTMHPYLTYSEAIKLCAQGFFKDIKKLSCCA